jgi:hypothetical protein
MSLNDLPLHIRRAIGVVMAAEMTMAFAEVDSIGSDSSDPSGLLFFAGDLRSVISGANAAIGALSGAEALAVSFANHWGDDWPEKFSVAAEVAGIDSVVDLGLGVFGVRNVDGRIITVDEQGQMLVIPA